MDWSLKIVSPLSPALKVGRGYREAAEAAAGPQVSSKTQEVYRSYSSWGHPVPQHALEVWRSSWGDTNTCLFLSSLARAPTTDQSKNSTRSSLVNQWIHQAYPQSIRNPKTAAPQKSLTSTWMTISTCCTDGVPFAVNPTIYIPLHLLGLWNHM